jgi:serine protease Do
MEKMSHRFTLVTVSLAAAVAFLVGLMVAGSFTPAPSVSVASAAPRFERPAAPEVPRQSHPVLNFADVAEGVNAAVVNIDATRAGSRRSGEPGRGAGSGFIIAADGYILTNHHVVDRAERVSVRLADGRSLRARIVGADPDTDIALLKVDGGSGLPVAPLGDSSMLRVGEWVCAIGNPLGYEHSVTVGVVSSVGRKLFDLSLDDYIQTDAAINFGNSGGPLLNARGEVVGINAAISSRASNIGFAVPINQATEILPQLKAHGRVSRGYIGVTLKDLDADLQQSLGIGLTSGALVQDVKEGSPGERADIRVYDLIVGVDGRAISNNEQLIREIAGRRPGTVARLSLWRDDRERVIPVKLAERPGRADWSGRPSQEEPADAGGGAAGPIGLTVRDIDPRMAARLDLPAGVNGVMVWNVEPMSPAFDASINRGSVVLEINRQPVRSRRDYERIANNARPGEVLAFHLYVPGDPGERTLTTLRVEGR